MAEGLWVKVDQVVMAIQKVNKQVERKFKCKLGIKEQKSRETREQLKCGETRDVAYTCRYSSGYLIPNSVIVID